MNREILLYCFRFVIFILLQVLVFNNMGIVDGGMYKPYIYVLFILLFPVTTDKSLFLLISFVFGLCLDVFMSTGGIHAISCSTIAFIRPQVLRFAFGVSYEFHTIKFSETNIGERVTYFSILILTHHLILFLLESFNFNLIVFTLKQTLFSGLYTLTLSLVLIVLFSRKRR